MTIRWFLQTIVILLCFQALQVMCEGVFEVSLMKLQNHRGVTQNGRCCKGPSTYPPCSGHCDTFVTVCLIYSVQYVPAKHFCPYGSNGTSVIGGNDIFEDSNITLSVAVNAIWPVNITIILDTWHAQDRTTTVYDHGQLISRNFVTTSLPPSFIWATSTTLTPHSEQTIKYRFTCKDHYYGDGCETICRPRDDVFGHQRCLENGTHICREGWKGPLCNEPICNEECSSHRGICERPNKCRCKDGWKGGNCEECKTREGCLNGVCYQPYQCICKTGWQGELCDIDINFCSRGQPCFNGGTCVTDTMGNYTCICPHGYIGNNCQYSVCRDQYCQNGGQCVTRRGRPLCSCDESFYGERCEHRKLTCQELPCRNGGWCEVGEQGGHCICPPQYTGHECETAIDLCSSSPCRPGEECRVTNSSRPGYTCVCKNGYTGEACSIPLNPCDFVTCLNAGNCTYNSNKSNPVCECASGYFGKHCELSWDPCAGIKCLNSGTCKLASSGNGFLCTCIHGYYGENCEMKLSACESSPCLNGGNCLNTHSSFRCRCRTGFEGRVCERRVILAPKTTHRFVYEKVTRHITTHHDRNGFGATSRGNKNTSIVEIIYFMYLLYWILSCRLV